MNKIVINATIDPKLDVDIEDGGQAMILTASDDSEQDKDDGIFVRIQSWDSTKQHEIAKQFIGKKIKIIIED